MIIIISAMSDDHFIGNQNGDGMPWDIPEEYQQFLDYIKGESLIMGRKSFEIFKVDLPSEHNFVISRSARHYENAISCTSIDDAIAKAREKNKIIYIAGGGQIYQQALAHSDKMYLSFIKGDFQGSVKFPDFDEEEWEMVSSEEKSRFTFVIYKRKDSLIK
jgi:dihydrofolate reductase